MTPARPGGLARVLDRAEHLLFDFDGPICDVYVGLPSAAVAEQLRRLLAAKGVTLPPPLMAETDPLHLLRFTDGLEQALTSEVDAALRQAEVTAVGSATSTPHAREALVACRRTGRGVAIVSNNSEAAIEAYLSAHDLLEVVDQVVGRTEADPSLLKPHPHSVIKAADALSTTPDRTALIGDSISDVEAALAAGAGSIGLANKPGKRRRLSGAGADAVIDVMEQLVDALRG